MVKQFIFIGKSWDFLDTSFRIGGVYDILVREEYLYRNMIFNSYNNVLDFMKQDGLENTTHITKRTSYVTQKFRYKMYKTELDKYFISLDEHRKGQIDMLLGVS